MKLATLQAGQFVETGGEAVKGDGGQARYLVTAGVSPDDSVSPDLANGNHALYQGVGAVNDLSQAYEFDTVALMKASVIVFPLGKALVTKGYLSERDGGGARYEVISEAQFPFGNKFEYDGVFHHLADGKMVWVSPVNNRLLDTQCGVKKADNTVRPANVIAWNNGSFCCNALGWTFVSSGDIHINNTVFIKSFSDHEFRGRCTFIHDDINTNEFGLVDIMSLYPVNIFHKASINLEGTVILKYIRDDAGLSGGNGFNIGNMSTSNLSGFECRVFDAEEAVHGQSIVDIQGGSFQATRCYRAMKIIPNAGVTSEASASTSFDFDVRSLQCVFGVQAGTAYYARITGWSDGNSLANVRRKAGDMPIACHAINNCQGLSFENYGFERCDGIIFRVEDTSTASIEPSTVALATDTFQSDATLINDVPFIEQGWISIGTACAVSIDNPSALLPYTPATDSWILSIGDGSRVNITSGKLGFNASGPKLFFVRGDISHLWINGTRNVPFGWSSGYEYHGNDKATFTGSAITAGGTGEVTVPFDGVFADLDSISPLTTTPNEGVIINYKSLAFNTITFKATFAATGAVAVAEVKYAITAFV